MGNSHAKHGKRIKLANTESDAMKMKARADYSAIIVSLTAELCTERYTQSTFGRNPESWLKEEKKKGTFNIPEKDEDYTAYIDAFLELVLDSEEGHICTPFFILKTVLVTEEELQSRQDPMISALRVQVGFN